MSSIVIAGNTYPDVPSIVVPKDGGGYATYTEGGSGGLEFVSTVKAKTEIALSSTDFNTWSPSSTAAAILATADLGTFTATDVAEWDYWSRVYGTIDVVYNSGTSMGKAMLYKVAIENWYCINKRASNLTNITSSTLNSTVAEAISNYWVLYYTTSASAYTINYSQSYGIYPANTAPAISSTTAASPTITVKRPVFNARCSSTYFSTTYAGKVDKANSKIAYKAEAYRSKVGYTRKFVQEGLVNSFNNGIS